MGLCPTPRWGLNPRPHSYGEWVFDKYGRVGRLSQGAEPTSALSALYFHDEAAAFAELEATLWPNGPVCPRCGGTERITSVKGGRMGLRRCGPCKRQFTVTVGTVFEASHVKLNLWLQAVYLMCSSEKGISSHQLMRTLDVQYKTAWFMTHRIREAMASGKASPDGRCRAR